VNSICCYFMFNVITIYVLFSIKLTYLSAVMVKHLHAQLLALSTVALVGVVK